MNNASLPIHMSNNSLQVRPGHQSRVEIRPNSSDKNIKENGQKNPMYQSYMEPTMTRNHNHLSSPQL
jgi:hypothetical protein